MMISFFGDFILVKTFWAMLIVTTYPSSFAGRSSSIFFGSKAFASYLRNSRTILTSPFLRFYIFAAMKFSTLSFAIILKPNLSLTIYNFYFIIFTMLYERYGWKTVFLMSFRFTEMLLLYFARASIVLLIPSIIMFSFGLENRQKKSYVNMFVFC